MISVVIPSRNEKYLQKTINDLLVKAHGNIEIIAVLDGYWPPDNEIVEDPRVHYIHFSQARGMRNAINSGVSLAKGQYILKTDAHCLFQKGFDECLVKYCKDDWVMVPRRLRLDPEKWEICEIEKPPVDYMYLAHPDDPSVWGGKSLQGKEWRERNIDPVVNHTKIDDLMTFQGSCWFMKKSYYEFLELMDEDNYGQFAKEAQEIGLKAWLSGGRVVVNKKTSYAHWHKPKEVGRGYSLSNGEFKKGSEYTAKWLTERVWHKQTRDFQWLIDTFSPVPGWKGKDA
jgi:glycosyltransferase involved in cell wall biosynthesis